MRHPVAIQTFLAKFLTGTQHHSDFIQIDRVSSGKIAGWHPSFGFFIVWQPLSDELKIYLPRDKKGKIPPGILARINAIFAILAPGKRVRVQNHEPYLHFANSRKHLTTGEFHVINLG